MCFLLNLKVLLIEPVSEKPKFVNYCKIQNFKLLLLNYTPKENQTSENSIDTDSVLPLHPKTIFLTNKKLKIP